MNKKTLKMLVAVVVFATMIAISSSVFALTPDNMEANISTNTKNTMVDFGQNIMGILQTVGVIVAVLIIIILGIKYMMGSAEEKAEYKKTMMPYIIGAILIFAATTIANVIVQFAEGL